MPRVGTLFITMSQSKLIYWSYESQSKLIIWKLILNQSIWFLSLIPILYNKITLLTKRSFWKRLHTLCMLQLFFWFLMQCTDLNHVLHWLGGVHKLRLQEEGGRWSKKSTFCKPLYHRKCKRRGVGGQKKAKSCKRSLWTPP